MNTEPIYEKISVSEQKKISLDILVDVARFCEENGLRYFLAYGTLLGAVRHGGYIPWDDDIDIQMPREDYNRLIEIYNEKKSNPDYELIAPQSKKARHPFVKVIDTTTVKYENAIDYSNGTLGIDIDIFPIDGMPDTVLQAKYYKKLKNIYQTAIYCVLDPNRNLKYRVAVPLIKLLSGGRIRLLKRAEKLHAKYPYETAEYVGSFEDCWTNPNDRVPKNIFEAYEFLEFEGVMFRVPHKYAQLLTTIYGDYMTPPANPETHHNNECYRINEALAPTHDIFAGGGGS